MEDTREGPDTVADAGAFAGRTFWRPPTLFVMWAFVPTALQSHAPGLEVIPFSRRTG